jgi:hypothetical protein
MTKKKTLKMPEDITDYKTERSREKRVLRNEKDGISERTRKKQNKIKRKKGIKENIKPKPKPKIKTKIKRFSNGNIKVEKVKKYKNP